MSIKITYFVHGTTTDNEDKIGTGWNPGQLSKIGRQQSEELGILVTDKQFDAVFCSDLKRAMDSANLAFGNKYKIIPDKRLREMSYGDFNGHKLSEFKSDPKEYINNPFKNGECYKDVEKRVSDFINHLKQNCNGQHIAIVAHQGPQLALDVLLKDKTWKQAIDEDWRKVDKWQPGWEYLIE